MATTLSDTKLRAVKAGSEILTDSACTGLLFRPSLKANGVGSWMFRYTSPDEMGRNGQPKRVKLTLGRYPKLGLREARQMAQELTDKVAAGIDPRRGDDTPAADATFARVLEMYFDYRSPAWKGGKQGPTYLKRRGVMDRNLIPALGDRKMQSIAAKDLAAALSALWGRTKAEGPMALSLLGGVWDFAVGRGYARENIIKQTRTLLPRKPRNVSHNPSQDYRQIPAFVRERTQFGLSALSNADLLVLFVLLTASRVSAARLLRWGDIDDEQQVWHIYPDRELSKVRRVGRYPIGTHQRRILDEMRMRTRPETDLVFPTNRPSATGSWALNGQIGTKLQQMRIESTTPGRYATIHGWRSSFTDWCVERDVPDSIIERQLQHIVANRVRAAYERSDQLDARRHLMQEWEDYCFSLIK